jgi:hypothetical protein
MVTLTVVLLGLVIALLAITGILSVWGWILVGTAMLALVLTNLIGKRRRRRTDKALRTIIRVIAVMVIIVVLVPVILSTSSGGRRFMAGVVNLFSGAQDKTSLAAPTRTLEIGHTYRIKLPPDETTQWLDSKGRWAIEYTSDRIQLTFPTGKKANYNPGDTTDFGFWSTFSLTNISSHDVVVKISIY